MYRDTLIMILFSFFLIAFVIGTILIVIRAIKGYTKLQKADDDLSLDSFSHKPSNAGSIRRRFLIKAFIAFGLWLLFSLYAFSVDASNSIGRRIGDPPLIEVNSDTIGLIAIHVFWVLAGVFLIYWIGKAPKLPAKLP